jgi:hypothetical protein
MGHQHKLTAWAAVGVALVFVVACSEVEDSESIPEAASDIIRYTGPESDVTVVHRNEYGASYSSSSEVMNALQVGMTNQEVSDILKADFAPSQGIMFRFYSKDTYLHVGFENGRVSELRRGHNGICLGLRE